MAIVVPTSEAVKDLRGLHLYHADISNCSMRVRMVLAEKGLDWTSHHIDLRRKENISEDYFAINPNGLVPTLVDDGVVHIESNDIIDHLDRTRPDPPLRAGVEHEAEMMEWLHLAAAIHVPACKPYVYATKIAAKIVKSQDEQARYDALQTNEELKRFHAKHAGANAFTASDLDKATAILNACFDKLEATLAHRPWMMGERFTLADISWAPLHFVLAGCGYPFDRYPKVQRWAGRLREHRSYREGVLNWCADFAHV